MMNFGRRLESEGLPQKIKSQLGYRRTRP
jgi:hypothetical protein